jgi:hypothetical protein
MARLDTGWHAHPKILALGLDGMGLHAWSISYCDHVLSDGFIPAGAWPALPGVRGAVRRIVAAGLWQAVEGGYWLHDYADYNRTKAQVAAEREESRVRKMSGRNPAGQTPGIRPESGRIPRAPGPGPLSTTTTAAAAAAAASTPSGSTPARARTRGKPVLSPDLQAEHERYLARERAAAAAAAAANSISSNGGRRG